MKIEKKVTVRMTTKEKMSEKKKFLDSVSEAAVAAWDNSKGRFLDVVFIEELEKRDLIPTGVLNTVREPKPILSEADRVIKKVAFTRMACPPAGSPGQGGQRILVNGRDVGILLKDPQTSSRKPGLYTVLFNQLEGQDKTFYVPDYPSARAAYEAARAYAKAKAQDA